MIHETYISRYLPGYPIQGFNEGMGGKVVRQLKHAGARVRREVYDTVRRAEHGAHHELGS
jgi:hypothetical protein